MNVSELKSMIKDKIPDGMIYKYDISIAKNYLNERE